MKETLEKHVETSDNAGLKKGGQKFAGFNGLLAWSRLMIFHPPHRIFGEMLIGR